MILSIVLAVIVVSVLVVSHEFGHFLLAKKNGIGVVEFSVGMGPRILSKEKGIAILLNRTTMPWYHLN